MKYPLYNNTLCPRVWDKSIGEYEMKQEIREELLKIATDFIKRDIKENKLPLTVADIILIGSLTNFNWTKYSDFDVHIVVQLDDLDMPMEEAQLLVDGLKGIWNKNHSITIKGHPVELYVQDSSAKPYSLSAYSIKNGEWIKEPTKDKPEFDKEYIKNKHEKIKSRLDAIFKNPSEEALEAELEKIYTLRQSGLDSGGEFSSENLVFKILRAQGYLDKLKSLINKTYDSEHSIDEVHKVHKIDDGIGLSSDTKLVASSDEDDDLIPIDDDHAKRIHKINISGIPIKVFAAYETKPAVASSSVPDWDDKKTFNQYLSNIRHVIKYPNSSHNKKLIDGWIDLSMERLRKQLPELSEIDAIVPLGSKSNLNVKIANEIKKYAPNATIISGMINKLTWKDVQLSSTWRRENDMIQKDGNPRPWLKAISMQLDSKKENYPNEPFEIKLVTPGARRYFSSFYSASSPERLNGKTVILIDDTLEQGVTLREAMRSIVAAKPSKILAYIFLFKVMA